MPPDRRGRRRELLVLSAALAAGTRLLPRSAARLASLVELELGPRMRGRIRPADAPLSRLLDHAACAELERLTRAQSSMASVQAHALKRKTSGDDQ